MSDISVVFNDLHIKITAMAWVRAETVAIYAPSAQATSTGNKNLLVEDSSTFNIHILILESEDGYFCITVCVWCGSQSGELQPKGEATYLTLCPSAEYNVHCITERARVQAHANVLEQPDLAGRSILHPTVTVVLSLAFAGASCSLDQESGMNHNF